MRARCLSALRGAAAVAAAAGATMAGCGDNTPARREPAIEIPALDPGHVTLRRLNRVEYNNTVRDLLGTMRTPADDFPSDEVADGFDTVGDYLAFTMERAQSVGDAAETLVDELVALPADDPRRARVFLCAPEGGADPDCARQILGGFARRAWRRPVTGDELADLLQIVDEAQAAGASFDDGLRNALVLTLISPHFLYRVETSAEPEVAAALPVNDDQLATRLSYFLWSSMPDDALFAAADAGTLSAELPAHVARMLDDPRASSLAVDFAGQWLSVRTLPGFAADTTTFPTFAPDLPLSAAAETTAFFNALITEDLPIQTLLLANFTFANARLGEDYGLPVTGDELARIDLTGTPRVGVLTQGSFLMSTSLPARTSPVKRGAWVLDRLLCTPPPPVPANLAIPALEVPPPGATLRQALEAHRTSPICATCHNVMDPIGLGLENFDAIGQYRTSDNGAPVDATGMLPEGQTFSGARELATLLAHDPRFTTCAMQKLLTYAVGRPFSTDDGAAYAAALARATIARGQGTGTWRRWVEAVATSDAFRTRRGVAP